MTDMNRSIELTDSMAEFLDGNDAIVIRASDFERIQEAVKSSGLDKVLDNIMILPLTLDTV